MSNNLCPAILYLADGTVYRGWSFFKLSSHFGEIVFNTGMVGYQEIFTDPSYSGQMVVFTYPELGNTGLNYEDNESSLIHITALIAKNISAVPSNWRSATSLKDFLIRKRLPHIFGIDTRSLTKHLRSCGVMNAVLLNSYVSLNNINLNLKRIDQTNLLDKVTIKHQYCIDPNILSQSPSSGFYFRSGSRQTLATSLKILVIDFGIKLNILRNLLHLGCTVHVVPANCDYKIILQHKPDGVLLSNGPGNPFFAINSIDTVRNLIHFSNIPIFGICMGHQILNLALGAETFKLIFGHRGLNHPSGCSSYSEITSQNHGFAVHKPSLLKDEVSQFLQCNFCNLNDYTVASTLHKSNPIFSVQYHPEASPGPRDSSYLFNTFVELVSFMKSKN